MTTTFEALVDKVEEAFLDFTDDTTVKFQRGKLSLALNEQARRIVFVRPGGKVTPSTRRGSADLGDGSRARMVKRREERVFAHLFAESETAAEAMLDNLIASCEAMLGTGFQPVDYDWKTEDKQAAHSKYTELIVLQMAWHKPVLDRAEPMTELALQDHTCLFGAVDFVAADFLSTDFRTGETA